MRKRTMCGTIVVSMAFAAALAGTEVYSTGFDTTDGVKGWHRNAIWTIEKGSGVDGSDALVWTNSDPNSYDVQSYELHGIRPGMMLRARFKVKVESLSGAKLGCTICWHGPDGYMGGAGGTEIKWGDRRLKPDKDGWYSMSIKTPYLPAKTKSCLLQLYVHRDGVGKVLFDDVCVEIVGSRDIGSIESLATSAYRDMASDGDVRIVAEVEIPQEYDAPGKVMATLSYAGCDGTRTTAEMSILPISNAELAAVTLPVAAFAMGRNPVRVELKGADGKVFGARETWFERVEKIPQRRVAFDEYGRTLVDGSLFFPLGMYWSENTLGLPGALDRYAAAGVFNCLQTYEKSMSPEILDRYWKYGLRVIASVKDVYVRPEDGTHIGFTPPEVKTRTDETNYVRRVVERCRNHPALLAWYTCDEMLEKFHDRLNDRYGLMKLLDPDHPTFACINIQSSSKRFMDSTDVIGVDSYPVGKAGRILPPDFDCVWEAGDKAEIARDLMCGILPMWHIPQAFSWRWDFWKKTDLRFPIFRELRSMVWQMIAAGGNGVLLYSYGQILNCKEDAAAKEEYFRRSCEVAREVKGQMPVLLLEPGPEVVSSPARVRARTWRDGANAYVLVCNTHPERRIGALRVKGAWKSCETVFGGGVSLTDGALSLDMEPLAVAIVKLVADLCEGDMAK